MTLIYFFVVMFSFLFSFLYCFDQTQVDGYSDTLVMQNLGYFQLQANPGLFLLGTAQGRASELFALQQKQVGVANGVMQIPVRTFEDEIHRLLVHKRAGMEHLSLLGDNDDEYDVDATASAGKYLLICLFSQYLFFIISLRVNEGFYFILFESYFYSV